MVEPVKLSFEEDPLSKSNNGSDILQGGFYK